MEFSYFMPVRLLFGANVIDQLGATAKSYGTHALIVTGRSSTKRSGLLDRSIALLEAAGVRATVFNKVEPNPLTTTVMEGAALAREQGCDLVIGMGGGSMMDAAKAHKVSLLRTADGTSAFMAGLIAELNVELAPRVTRHGVLVEVYGEGILLLGESGVGKSETAIELVKRGHRLIADDAVEIRRVSAKTLVGSSPENIRHFMELRGVGIINARRLFGIGAVKMTEKINMIVQLEQWDATKVYDRMGMNEEYTDVLGVQVSSSTIPVKPGRNLAIIIEVAAMNNRQKRMGYNAAQELLEKLGMVEPDSTQTTDWGDF